ncbi:MAG TPA: dihydrofolate reductase family protein [Bacteroidia bacterium]|nr:dihydrofolate reductase family protein [Bacteroidia bacterium]
MRKLTVFNFMTLDGYFEGPKKGEYAWHKHTQTSEETEYAEGKLQYDNTLLFGRVTYDQMVSFWPTENAIKMFPDVAKGMNKAEKIVFSNSLKKPDWNNTSIMKGDIVEEIRKLKNTSGKDMTILGSGSIITLFAENGLIDEFQFMVDPIAIGKGTPIFKGIKHQLNLKLISTKAFKDGVVILTYKSN